MSPQCVLRTLCLGLVTAGFTDAQTVSDLFDDSTVHEFRLEMDPADWRSLHENYLENTSYRCTFVWKNVTLQNVGVRARGSGSRNPIKPGLGLDFAKYESSQRLVTLKSLVLRNFAEDPSMVRERLAEAMFARMGLPFSREAFAKVYVNGKYEALYSIVEPFDSRYLRSRFGEDTGFLYEFNLNPVRYHFEYLGDDPSLYVPGMFEPKNHETNPEPEFIVAMIRTMHESTGPEFAAAVSKYLDLEQFVVYAAVEQFLGEADGVFGQAGMTNFYLYRRMADNRFVILPWDKEMSLAAADRSIWQNTDENVLMRRAMSVPAFKDLYLSTVARAAELAGGPGGWLEQEAHRLYTLLREAAREDTHRVCVLNNVYAPCPFEVFETANEYTQDVIRQRSEFTLAEVTNGSGGAANLTQSGGTVTNLASNSSVLVPGSLASLGGDVPVEGEDRAARLPLPSELRSVSVLVGRRLAPLISVAHDAIVFQVPWDVPFGPQAITRLIEGAASPPVYAELRPNSPAVFAAVHVNWDPVSRSHPARLGETLVLFTTGFGLVSAAQTNGEAAPFLPVTLTGSLEARVNGSAAKVLFAALAPGFVGLQQIVIQLPLVLEGSDAQLVLMADGEPGASFLLAVE